MGLDCYFLPSENITFPENCLVENQLNSFRGKRYVPFLLELTKEDLSQETLDTAAVQRIATALRAYSTQYQEAAAIMAPHEIVWDSQIGSFFDIDWYHLQQLILVFEFAAEHRLSLFNHQ